MGLYTTMTVKDKEYKLRLNAKSCIDLEKKLGENPLNCLQRASEGAIPSLEVLLNILHASLQPLNHGMSMEDTYNLYDNFVDEGNTLAELLPIIIEVFKCSGFFRDEDTDDVKNTVPKAKKNSK